MSKELCKNCLRFLFDLGRTKENDVPWIHCHHEDAKKCPGCDGWAVGRIVYYHTFTGLELAQTSPCKYCPECGKKLET